MKYNKLYEQIMDKFNEGYSEKTKEFVQKFGLNRKDVKAVMQQHKDLKDKGILDGDNANIDKVSSFDDLKNIVLQYKGQKSKSTLKKDSKTILNNDRWKIEIPKTYESSCKIGTGTKWCTAAKTRDKWDQYENDKTTLYYIQDKTKTMEDDPQFYKFAIVVTEDGTITEIRDAQDNDMSWKAFEGITKLDKGLFKPDME